MLMLANEKIAALHSELNDLVERERQRRIAFLEAQQLVIKEFVENAITQTKEHEKIQRELDRRNWEIESHEAMQRHVRQLTAQHSEHLLQMSQFLQEKFSRQSELQVREAVARETRAFEAALLGWKLRMEAIEKVVDGESL
ncbi:unnamed protein product [Protopolystoma xenopodis]|uniref:Mitofilin n=1 Tax=Protopolystoma xenopodis TaxID=117903 RepID=A0A3S5CGK4_9PLAT|nr:unnamed protein product [Protopolystoma xenopodis]